MRYRDGGAWLASKRMLNAGFSRRAKATVLGGAARIEEAILRNTEVSCDHSTPELKLHLLTPNCRLYRAPLADRSERATVASDDPAVREAFREPFWSIYWPGGQALTRWILDEGVRCFLGGRGGCGVLDLGAGCGASAIAARLVGARRVLANDVDPVACIATSMNAALNGVSGVEVSSENLLTSRGPHRRAFDVVFVGDLLYDEEIVNTLVPWLDEALRAGSKVYVGDPGRHGVRDERLKDRLTLLREYSLPENARMENNGFVTTGVWRFR